MQRQNYVSEAPKPGAEYLNERQLADRLGVSERTLQGWRLKGGGVPYYKIGRLVRYSVIEVTTWLSGRQCEHTSDAAARELCSIRQVYENTSCTPVNAADLSALTLQNGSAE